MLQKINIIILELIFLILWCEIFKNFNGIVNECYEVKIYNYINI